MNEHRKHSIINNERGNALLYCLLIVMVLMVVTPMIMMNVSREKLTSTKMEDNIQVNTLASSAMEEFLNYLGTSGTLDGLKTYPGWGTKKIILPNGKLVELSQISYKPATGTSVRQQVVPSAITMTDLIAPSLGIDVEVMAKSGGSSVKLFKYNIKGIENKLVINPSDTVPADPSKPHLLTRTGGSHNNIATVHNLNGIGAAINEYIASVTGSTGPFGSYKKYISDSNNKVTCTDPCTIQNVQHLYNTNSNNPMIIQASNISLTHNGLIEIGSVSRPLVLHITGSLTYANIGGSNKPQLTVTGNIFVNNLNADIIGSLIVKKPNPPNTQFGNLFAEQNINFNTDSDFLSVDGLIFAGNSLQFINSGNTTKSTLEAGSIVVGDMLKINAQMIMTITNHIIGKRIEFMNQKHIEVTAGDILGAEYVQMEGFDNQENPPKVAKINSTGLIASGNFLNINNAGHPDVKMSATGTLTALQCSGGQSIYSSGGCSSGLSYVKKRQ